MLAEGCVVATFIPGELLHDEAAGRNLAGWMGPAGLLLTVDRVAELLLLAAAGLGKELYCRFLLATLGPCTGARTGFVSLVDGTGLRV